MQKFFRIHDVIDCNNRQRVGLYLRFRTREPIQSSELALILLAYEKVHGDHPLSVGSLNKALYPRLARGHISCTDGRNALVAFRFLH